MIKERTRFIVLKYGTGINDCIQLHKNVISKYGYCWFGKIGVAPSENSIFHKLNEEELFAVLYRQGIIHLCRFDKISFDKPSGGYPVYYESYFFNRNITPSIYFRLLSIEEMDYSVFAKCVSLGSGNKLLDTVSRSMASFFYGILPDSTYVKPVKKEKRIENTDEKKIRSKVNTKGKIVENSCKYSKDGICTCKSSVNYEYACERPSTCIKQKPNYVEV